MGALSLFYSSKLSTQRNFRKRDTWLIAMISVRPKKNRGEKWTIIWYVDDKKASPVNPKVVDELISYLKVNFGVILITRGNKHYFTGMNI